MHGVLTLVFKLLRGRRRGDFEAFAPKISPTTRIYDAHISTLVATCKTSDEVESRYLQEKVTSLQVESGV